MFDGMATVVRKVNSFVKDFYIQHLVSCSCTDDMNNLLANCQNPRVNHTLFLACVKK